MQIINKINFYKEHLFNKRQLALLEKQANAIITGIKPSHYDEYLQTLAFTIGMKKNAIDGLPSHKLIFEDLKRRVEELNV